MTQHQSLLAIPNPFKSLPLIIFLPFVLISSTFTIVTMNAIQNEVHDNATAYLELLENTVYDLESDNLAAISSPIDCKTMQENLMFENKIGRAHV